MPNAPPNVLRKRSDQSAVPNDIFLKAGSTGQPELEVQPQRRRLVKRTAPPAVQMPEKLLHPEAEGQPDSTQRPPGPSRQLSYQKRHASFDSPREVPLPTPTTQQPPFQFTDPQDSGHPQSPTDYPVFDQSETSTDGSGSLPRGSSQSRPTSPKPPVELSSIYTPQLSTAGPVFPNVSRPYSLPGAHSKSYGPTEAPVKPKVNAPDRTSSASLPLPSQTPYYTLPRVANVSSVEEGREWNQPGPSTSRPEPATARPPVRKLQPMPVPESISARLSQALSMSSSKSESSSGETKIIKNTSVSPTSLLPTAMTSRPLSHTSMSSISSTVSYPPPQPPTILTPGASPPVDDNTRAAPYEPFLSHAPPPEDSWIAVETTQREYRLVVRLPGFDRDGITLATRRRRILHVVADSWRPGGGHFERRIAFGYDADLAQVRAEFNGELLTVIVPRRLSPVTGIYAPVTPGFASAPGSTTGRL